jgi:hypothetical protein
MQGDKARQKSELHPSRLVFGAEASKCWDWTTLAARPVPGANMWHEGQRYRDLSGAGLPWTASPKREADARAFECAA